MSSISRNRDSSIAGNLFSSHTTPELSSDWIVPLMQPFQFSYEPRAKLRLQVVGPINMTAHQLFCI